MDRYFDAPDPWEGRHCDECGWYVDELRACLSWDPEAEMVDAMHCDGHCDACEEFSPVPCVSRSLRSMVASQLELRGQVERDAALNEVSLRLMAEAMRR